MRIGTVTAVELSEDYSKVVVKAKIAKHAAGLMVRDANFWVVEPRINLSGVSGLNTLLSGNYIEFQAGKSEEEERNFVGLDDPPFIPGQHGRQFILKANTLGSLGVGAPIYYRQLQRRPGRVVQPRRRRQVGRDPRVRQRALRQVRHAPRHDSGTRAASMSRSAPTASTSARSRSFRCWPGGVAFDTPDFLPNGPAAEPDTVFTLYRTRAFAMKQPDPVERRYVLYFNESVRGLSVGAPVALLGLTVGEVTDVGLTFDAATLAFRPRVLITFFPERVIERLSREEAGRRGKDARRG